MDGDIGTSHGSWGDLAVWSKRKSGRRRMRREERKVSEKRGEGV